MNEEQKAKGAAALADDAGPAPDLSGTALPRPVQEHLAKELRAEYQLVADKPAFLGDPAIPVEFEHHLSRLDRREKAHERGIEAVKAALDLDEDGSGVPKPAGE